VSRRGGKGRVSNDLVAASAAAVLAVYAAGYWRTRDVAKRLEAQAQERRPSRVDAPVETPPPPAPAEPEPPVASVATPPTPAEAPAAAPAAKPTKSAKKPVKVAAAGAPPQPTAETKPAASEPAAILSVPLEEPSPPRPADPAPSESLAMPEQKLVDGTYTGWGQSYHGDIEARIVVRGGRIVEAGIKTCATRYPCDVIDHIIDHPVKWQNLNVDNVSRATESTDAYYYALVEALKQAQVE